jgi:hypothetical protein
MFCAFEEQTQAALMPAIICTLLSGGSGGAFACITMSAYCTPF